MSLRQDAERLRSAGHCAELHLQLLAFCIALKKEVAIVRPKKNGGDRTMTVKMNGEQEGAALVAVQAYESWLHSFISDAEFFLSRSDINLLESNLDEVKTYVLMQRRGQDVGVHLYWKLFFHELRSIFKQQESIVQYALSARAKPGLRGRPSYWRGVALTLGVEEELQIVSVDDWELKQDVDMILASVQASGISREVYKSQIETKTGICDNIEEVRTSLTRLRQQVFESLPKGLAVLSAGTHPFSTWNQQEANQTARTDLFMHDMQDVVRRLVTCGLHVHVGVEDRDLAMQIMNASRQFLPVLLAVSASSPLWEGRVTGLASYRSTVFSALPRTGIPPKFDDYGQYRSYLQLLGDTHSFDSLGNFDPTKIWWDVRLHPEHPTIEFRICDACTRIDDAVCIAALCQAIVGKIAKLLHMGVDVRDCKKEVLDENKWRALRYGHRARFIDPDRREEVFMRYTGRELLDLLDDVLPQLGSRNEAHRLTRIIREGTSAKRQVEEFVRTGDIRAVVRALSEEFLLGAA